MAHPIEKFSQEVNDTLNSEKFIGDCISVFSLQTGLGKSRFQDLMLSPMIKSVFSGCKFIIRLAPTKDAAYDGTFVNVESLTDSEYKFSYLKCDQVTENTLKILSTHTDSSTVFCMSITHSQFSSNFLWLKKYADKSVIVIEEAHSFTGLADPGSEPYKECHGYSTENEAMTMQRIKEWMKINPRVIAFTATPTKHQEGDAFFSKMYEICSELADLPDIVPYQSWIDSVNSYEFDQDDPDVSGDQMIEDAIDKHFLKEQILTDLKEKDSNINPKLSGIFHCGPSNAKLGLGVMVIMQKVAEYLKNEYEYPANTPMLCKTTEKGQEIYDLDLNVVERIETDGELFEILKSINSECRFLFCIEKCKNGANIHNLSTQVFAKVRRPMKSRYMIPTQMLGRMLRINTATGDLIRTDYHYDLEFYLKNYPSDYNVNIEDVVDTLKISNKFDIYYLYNDKLSPKGNLSPHIETFREFYCNDLQTGIRWMSQFSERSEEELISTIEIEVKDEELKCPQCGYVLNQHIDDWSFDGTLDRFFHM